VEFQYLRLRVGQKENFIGVNFLYVGGKKNCRGRKNIIGPWPIQSIGKGGERGRRNELITIN